MKIFDSALQGFLTTDHFMLKPGGSAHFVILLTMVSI